MRGINVNRHKKTSLHFFLDPKDGIYPTRFVGLCSLPSSPCSSICIMAINTNLFKDTKFITYGTDMNFMFYGCRSLTSLDVSSFDTQNVTNMEGMFQNCSNLKTLVMDKNKFIISNETNQDGMYDGCNVESIWNQRKLMKIISVLL